MIDKDQWLNELKGKVIHGMRPSRVGLDPVPRVRMTFKDGTAYELRVKEDVYFEGCMINTLRLSQELEDITIDNFDGDYIVEFRARSFPMAIFLAENKKDVSFPFTLEKKEDADA